MMQEDRQAGTAPRNLPQLRLPDRSRREAHDETVALGAFEKGHSLARQRPVGHLRAEIPGNAGGFEPVDKRRKPRDRTVNLIGRFPEAVDMRDVVKAAGVAGHALRDIGIVIGVALDVGGNDAGLVDAALVHLPQQLLHGAALPGVRDGRIVGPDRPGVAMAVDQRRRRFNGRQWIHPCDEAHPWGERGCPCS